VFQFGWDGKLPSMSEISLAPNFPIIPCSFRPVNVLAIVQNLIKKNMRCHDNSNKPLKSFFGGKNGKFPMSRKILTTSLYKINA